MNENTFGFLKTMSLQARRVFWLAFAALVFGVAGNLLPIGQSPSVGAAAVLWMWRAFTAITPVIMWLSANGRARLGAWLLLGGVMFNLTAAVLAISGLGVSAGLILIILTIVLTSVMKMSKQDLTAANTLGIVLGISMVLFDLFGPARPSLPANLSRAIPVFLAIQVLIYGVVVFREFRNYTLRTKLVVAFLAAALIPFGLSFIVNNYAAEQMLTTDASANLKTAASATASTFDTFFEYSLSEVKTTAQLVDFIEFLSLPASDRSGSEAEEHMYQSLRALAGRDPVHITSVGLMDLDGQNIADTSPDQLGEAESQKHFFTETIESGLANVSFVELDEGALSFYFSAPVRDENGELLGILRVRYAAAKLQDLLVQATSNTGIPDGAAHLIDENHIFLGVTDTPVEILKTVAPLPAEKLARLQAASRLPEGDAQSLSSGHTDLESRLINARQQPTFALEADAEQAAVAFLKNQPWVVVISQPQSTFLESLLLQRRAATLVGLAIAGLAVLASLWVAQLMSRPLIDLTQVVQRIGSGNLDIHARVESEDEIGVLARTFNAMTVQLRELIGTLEQRVTDRTKALAASIDVSRRLSTILDEKQLVIEVVEQLKEAFDYYHVHIYLFDETFTELRMAGGTGEVGQTLLARGHSIPKGKGLVGRAAENNLAVLVSDTSQDPQWLPNPLLPETRSEVALPIAVGDRVLGVLDVQHNVTSALSREDADLLQSIANQVAVAVQNARLYARARQQAEREALVGSIGQKIRSTTTIENALQVAVRELGRALGSKETRIVLDVAAEKPGQNN